MKAVCLTKAISEELLIERRLSKMEKKLPYEELKLKLFFYTTNSDIVTASGGNNIGEDKGENDGEWTSLDNGFGNIFENIFRG